MKRAERGVGALGLVIRKIGGLAEDATDDSARRDTGDSRTEFSRSSGRHVIPALPVRQVALSVRNHLRYFLQRDVEGLSAVLHILLLGIGARLRQRSGCAGGRLRPVSFAQRFPPD